VVGAMQRLAGAEADAMGVSLAELLADTSAGPELLPTLRQRRT
jgi:hypothetical protein